ncbi:hypothetical protein EVAR_8226_1 [Eumeta japonica]|uniref:Reverse transcriptase domain-containing protein n=1 Tax=Eumeta variegata TaxID=151549 RepID=A0A4C1TIN7_EUMVA|nr:hypothetical protein EVAR_8226_1 [Eumeta japonica]
MVVRYGTVAGSRSWRVRYVRGPRQRRRRAYGAPAPVTVLYERTHSTRRRIRAGVLQGCLSPLLYSAYTDYIPGPSSGVQLALFADDTALYFLAREDSRDAIGVFCDLSKAFDCVYHDTLSRKLHHYGVTGRSLGLLESYLSDRIQRVDINEKAFREATSRHRSMNQRRNEETPLTAPTPAPTHKPQENLKNGSTTLHTMTTERMLHCAETTGKPGIRTRGMALFMDENTEMLGIGFGSP